MIVVVGLQILILVVFGPAVLIDCKKQKQRKSPLAQSPSTPKKPKKPKKTKKTKKRRAANTEMAVPPVANPLISPVAQQPEIRTQQTQPSSLVIPVDPKAKVPENANQNIAVNENKKPKSQLEKSIDESKSKTLKPAIGSAEVNKKFVEHSKTMSLKLANTDKTQIPSVTVPVAKPQAKKQRSLIAKISKKSVKSTKQEGAKGVKSQTADDDDEGLPIPQPKELGMDRTQRSLSNRPNDDDDTNDNIDDLRQDTQRSE
ncbi:hypothetical protein M3Y96_00992900 [Aphelenchoides besseyi]|nr:hypothetical protein M3Y96_00992900 [Aphelenchoides besseyi]